MFRFQLRSLFLFAAAIALVSAVASPANAAIYGFAKITDNGNPDVASQLSVDVTAGGGGTVNFKFYNNVGIATSITDIYFDDGTLLAIAAITDSANGSSFDDPAIPSNLPGGNLASPAFVTTQDFSADSDNPPVASGVNASDEWVNINFTLQGGQTYADTLASLASGALRIGLHVQGYVGGSSESYVNTATPEPASVIVWSLLALIGLGYGGWRRRAAA